MRDFFQEILGGVINLGIIPEGPGQPTKFIVDLVTNALMLLFVGIILVAIFYSAMAGLKYIRSQGEQEEVEQAQESIKSVLIGIAAVFVGVIAVLLISGIFANPGSDAIRESLCTFLEPNTPIKTCIEKSK